MLAFTNWVGSVEMKGGEEGKVLTVVHEPPPFRDRDEVSMDTSSH
jgi:hypothetical protein